MQEFRYNLGNLPDYRQLVTTLTCLKKATLFVIERKMLDQYQWVRGLFHQPGPLSPANN
jgi:hypothetical protein